MFCIFFNFFCEIQKTQGTADSRSDFVAVPEAANSDTSYMILIFSCFYLFQFIYKFQKTQGTGDSGTTFGAVPEAAKSDTSHMIFKKIFFAFFSKFLRISKNTRDDRFAVRFCSRPGGGKKRHILYDFNICISFIFFKNFANFSKHKASQIRGPILLPSWRRQKATHPPGF